MKMLQVQGFTLPELTGKPKEKAIQWLEEVATSWDWYRFSVEEWTKELEAKGYEGADISFSGFYSQGDGASFTAKVNLTRWLVAGGKKRMKKYSKMLTDIRLGYIGADVVRHSHQYSHKYTVGAEIWNDTEVKHLDAQGLEQDIDAEVRELSDTIYKALEEEYRSLQSEENLTGLAEANDYLFDKYGEPIHHLITT